MGESHATGTGPAGLAGTAGFSAAGFSPPGDGDVGDFVSSGIGYKNVQTSTPQALERNVNF